ncbi:MAG TPA: hypothetical protein VEI53_09985 [Ktedonobacteraceae bacterium]|nr:hypothetical protein [Ktedonobacteraceae bacterium]
MKNKLFLGLLAAGSGAYLLRRLGMRWGATDDEVHSSLSGDDLVPHPMLETTHAISIYASRAEVWPWLVQMGYDRAWWYTDANWYKWVDKYIWHTSHPSSPDHIIPELQHLEVGDTILDGPPGTAFFTVAKLEPGRVLALYSTTHILMMAPASLRNNPKAGIHGEFSWVFILDEKEGITRLIVRTRASYEPKIYRMLTKPVLFPADFLMARMMLQTIKLRVEQTSTRTTKWMKEMAPHEVVIG